MGVTHTMSHKTLACSIDRNITAIYPRILKKNYEPHNSQIAQEGYSIYNTHINYTDMYIFKVEKCWIEIITFHRKMLTGKLGTANKH